MPDAIVDAEVPLVVVLALVVEPPPPPPPPPPPEPPDVDGVVFGVGVGDEVSAFTRTLNSFSRSSSPTVIVARRVTSVSFVTLPGVAVTTETSFIPAELYLAICVWL